MDREHPNKEENVFVPLNDTVCYSALFLHLLAPRSTQCSWKKEVESAYTHQKTLFPSSTIDGDSLKTKQPFFYIQTKEMTGPFQQPFSALDSSAVLSNNIQTISKKEMIKGWYFKQELPLALMCGTQKRGEMGLNCKSDFPGVYFLQYILMGGKSAAVNITFKGHQPVWTFLKFALPTYT